MVSVHLSSRAPGMPTISSLHIGHTSLLEALAAAAFSVLASKTLLPMSSLVSAVLAGLTDVCELRDTELSEGDIRLALRSWWGRGRGDTAGERCFPLPSTRPPPRDLPEVMLRSRGGEEQRRGCWRLRCRHGALGAVELSGLVR
jgi:hypothetical protein